MPNKNVIQMLHTYGPIAIELESLTELIDGPFKRDKVSRLLAKLAKLNDDTSLRLVVEGLSQDSYAYNRELAADTIRQLWLAWKFIPYEDEKTYHKSVKGYVTSLAWTVPIIESLLTDSAVGPTELAVMTMGEMGPAGIATQRKLRPLVLRTMHHKSADVRLQAVRNLHYIYPFGDDGAVLDGLALEAMLVATYDENEKVRDWAIFTLHNDIQSTDERVQRAYLDAFQREDPDSDTYMEAVVGLAKTGMEGEASEVICKNLKREDCGSGWIDAAVASKTEKCHEAMERMRTRLLNSDPDDARLDYLSNLLGY